MQSFENPRHDNINKIKVNLIGRYPDTSFNGHKYIYVMHNYSITNNINTKGLKSRKVGKLFRDLKNVTVTSSERGYFVYAEICKSLGWTKTVRKNVHDGLV